MSDPHWQFGTISPDEKEQDVTQRDQFNNDAIGLAEALVREAIQNSTDANSSDSPVTVRFRTETLAGRDAATVRTLLRPLAPHLEATGWSTEPLGENRIELLLVEDFGTTGLTGSVVRRDRGNFYNFWRRLGGSNKRGSKGGRWGLGKLVFSSASQIGAFFGLTIREGDASAYLMGEAALKVHEIDDTLHRWYGYFADHEGSVPLPSSGVRFVQDFRSATRVRRSCEPGLSIVIPYVHDINHESILGAIAKNYYFPILLDRLIVDVNGTVLNRVSLHDIAQRVGKTLDVPFDFIRRVGRALSEQADFEGLNGVTPQEPNAAYFPEEVLDALREKYASGDVVHVRLPVELTTQAGEDELSWIDLFLQRTPAEGQPYSIFVRDRMVIPEERYGVIANVRGAMVASESSIATFLGDAENPAHTRWNENAERLRKNWHRPHLTLRAVRHSLRNLHRTLADEDQTVDKTALVRFFSVPVRSELGGGGKEKFKRKRDTVPPWRIEPRKGAFRITHTTETPGLALPMDVRVLVSYDTPVGDPFRQYEQYDFDLSDQKTIKVEEEGAHVVDVDGNAITFRLTRPSFVVTISGFDVNRDLVVRAETT
ncbi:MAG: hypothetical protein OYK82_00740 [Gammaproteobacteria bacterium]|nr:hypothetical protein [Gammaproteobacteria bacterium]